MRQNGSWALVSMILLLVACAPLSASKPGAHQAPKLNPAWRDVLKTVGKDGTVSKDTALKAFAIAIAPLPGVDVPQGETRFISDGTFALRGLVAHWSELTPQQREAAAAAIPELKGIQVGAAQATSETTDPALPYLPVGAKSTDATSANYADIAKQVADLIAAKVHQTLSISISISEGKVQQSTSAAETGVYSANGTIFGKPAKCVITVGPEGAKQVGDELKLVIAHEVWHCFEGEFGGIPWVWVGPSWIVEGEAEWVCDMLFPDTSITGGWWPDYLENPGKSLFQRTYDALGFYSQLNQTTDVWTKLIGALGKSSQEGFVKLGADSDKFLDIWGPGYLRDPSRGPAWEITGPGITPDKASATSISIPNGSSVTESAAAYTDEIARLVDSPDVMQVTASGHGRISDSAGKDFVFEGGGGTYCLKKDGCKCPNADVSEPPPLQLSGSVALGITGGPSGSSATLDGMSLEDFCNKGPLAGTWEGTWVNDNGLANGAYTLVIKQKKKTGPFSGTIQVSGKTCIRNGDIQGTLTGQQVTWGLVNAERPIDFTGTLYGKTSMSGSWSAIACGPPYGPPGGPYQVTGTWQAKKTK